MAAHNQKPESLFTSALGLLEKMKDVLPDSKGVYKIEFPITSELQHNGLFQLLAQAHNIAYHGQRCAVMPSGGFNFQGMGEITLGALDAEEPLRINQMQEVIKQLRRMACEELGKTVPADDNYSHIAEEGHEKLRPLMSVLRALGEWHECEDSPVIGMGEAWLRRNNPPLPYLSIDNKARDIILSAERGNSPDLP